VRSKYFRLIDLFIKNTDVARNNANFVRSLPVLEHIVTGEIMKDYLLNEIYKGLPVKIHHEEGWAYHHQLYKISLYCLGLSAKDIAYHGLQSNAKNERKAKPPKRLETLFMQCANLICLISQEVSGATSLNDISTVAAGYLWYLETNNIKKYSDYDLKNIWQEFLYNVNLPFRSGNSPFSNITLDFGKPNARLKDEPVVYAGKLLDITYKDIPAEYYDRINMAFINAMYEGDADGNPFTFPLITVNITENFDWENKAWKELLKKSEYFGGFYVQNYLKEPFEKDSVYKKKNPYIKPFDEGMIYSNCCFTGDMCIVDAETASPVSFEELYRRKQKGERLPLVISFDEETRKFKVSKIKEVAITRYVKELCEVELDNGFVIKCTPDHLFLTGRYGWVQAKDLKPGTILVWAKIFEEEDGYLKFVGFKIAKNKDTQNRIEDHKVKSVRIIKLENPIPVYDIEVEKYHNFLLWTGDSRENATKEYYISTGVIVHNCRMMYDISLIETVTGSNPFHSGAGVGGVGVYAINLNRLLYLAKRNEDILFAMLDYLLEMGAKALQRKREWVMKHYEDLYPYVSFYQRTDKSLYNIFSVVGAHEGMINAGFDGGLFNDEAKDYAHKIAQHIYAKIEEFMKRDGVLYSLEYAPSENAACRLAEKDLMFAKIVEKYLNGEHDVRFSEDNTLNTYTIEALARW